MSIRFCETADTCQSLIPTQCQTQTNSFVYKSICYVVGYFVPTARSHWLLRGHMIFNNETVFCQNLLTGNIANSMTSVGNSALLPANLPLQRGKFPASQLSSGNTEILSGNKMNCFPRDQSLSVQCFISRHGDISTAFLF